MNFIRRIGFLFLKIVGKGKIFRLAVRFTKKRRCFMHVWESLYGEPAGKVKCE